MLYLKHGWLSSASNNNNSIMCDYLMILHLLGCNVFIELLYVYGWGLTNSYVNFVIYDHEWRHMMYQIYQITDIVCWILFSMRLLTYRLLPTCWVGNDLGTVYISTWGPYSKGIYFKTKTFLLIYVSRYAFESVDLFLLWMLGKVQ